ncbi:structural protein [Escherichia phage UB]|uniref:Structural protein n=1 Tax=Escherichia phage UB TaxID=2268588 RepID=A0A2Z5H8V2_9CAUD|nr:structural protein [Escherichia phage UB]
MPDNFKSKNGATISGHSEKWSEKNRRPNSHMAGQGSKGSRNMGTGEAGKANTVATQGTDTSNMTELEKLRYVNSLGLLNATQKQRLADMEREEKEKSAPAKEEPKQEAPKAVNPVKELSDKLGKIFANKPQLIQGIVKELQSVPKEELKVKAQAVLDAMSGNTSTEPTEVFSTIMRALEGKQKSLPQKTDQQPSKPSGRMSEDEFREVNDYLGAKFVNDIINQAKQYTDLEKALYIIDMAIENVDDVNDSRAVRMSMSSAADDLTSMGLTLKDEDENNDIEFDEHSHDDVNLESILKTFDSIGKADRANAQQVKNVLAKLENRLEGKDDKVKLVSDAVNSVLKSYVQGEKSRFVTAMDAAFNTMKKYEAEHGEKVTPDGYLKRADEEGAVEQKDVHSDEEIDDMEAELSQDRQMTEKSHNELQKLMQWVADVGEKAGADKKSINRNLSWIKDKVGNNARKLQKAWTDVVNGAVDIDVESGEAYDYALTTLDDSFRDYENGNVTPWEKDIMSKYGK